MLRQGIANTRALYELSPERVWPYLVFRPLTRRTTRTTLWAWRGGVHAAPVVSARGATAASEAPARFRRRKHAEFPRDSQHRGNQPERHAHDVGDGTASRALVPTYVTHAPFVESRQVPAFVPSALAIGSRGSPEPRGLGRNFRRGGRTYGNDRAERLGFDRLEPAAMKMDDSIRPVQFSHPGSRHRNPRMFGPRPSDGPPEAEDRRSAHAGGRGN